MRNMFTMMNAARIGVGMEGLASTERALQHGHRAYATKVSRAGPIGALVHRAGRHHRASRRPEDAAHHEGEHGGDAGSALLHRPGGADYAATPRPRRSRKGAANHSPCSPRSSRRGAPTSDSR
jgi:hypothetical protein